MTAAGSPSGTGRRGTRVLPFLALGVALVLVVVLAGRPNEEGTPFDPTNNGRTGTKGLVTMLDELGADVDITDDFPPDEADVALALPGVVPADREEQLLGWVESGGVLVVADPRSDLSAPRREAATFGGLVNEVLEPRTCTIPALRGIGTIKPAGGFRLGPVEGDGVCFTRDEAAFVVDHPVGRGRIVSLGGATLLTNELLGSDDNAVLAAALLAPRPGYRVAVLTVPPGLEPGEGPDLTALIGTGVRLALVQLGLAFVVYAFWRGRRLGHPILEPQPVELAGSELVDAVGQLLAQTRSPTRAAAILRADLRRELTERLGLAPDAPPEVIADVAFARTGADRDRVLLAVTDVPVPDEAGLLAAARAIDSTRQEVLHGSTL